MQFLIYIQLIFSNYFKQMSIQSGIVNKDLIVKGMGFFSKDVKIKGKTCTNNLSVKGDLSIDFNGKIQPSVGDILIHAIRKASITSSNSINVASAISQTRSNTDSLELCFEETFENDSLNTCVWERKKLSPAALDFLSQGSATDSTDNSFDKKSKF